MKNLLIKEFKLATPVLTYLFIGFAFMTFIPGYPILCGAFFVCLGIFQGYQINRDSNDILYSVLLPVSKREVVKAKYLAACALQMGALALCIICTLIRMVFMVDSQVYKANLLMAANPVYLAFVLLIFTAFNVIFIGGFFKTAYGIGRPFVVFIVINFVIISIGEVLHHLPGLEWMNALDFSFIGMQMVVLILGAVVYAAVTMMSCLRACDRFEKIDL